MKKETYTSAMEQIEKMPEEYREAARQDLRTEYMDDLDRLIRANQIEAAIEDACHQTIWEYASGRISLYEAIDQCIIDLRMKKGDIWNELIERRTETQCPAPAEEE